ncbi:hypothetical protein D3C86_1510460 [compost metagenome]
MAINNVGIVNVHHTTTITDSLVPQRERVPAKGIDESSGPSIIIHLAQAAGIVAILVLEVYVVTVFSI